MATIMASVLPQVTTKFSSASSGRPMNRDCFFGQRGAKILGSPGDGVLVRALARGAFGGLEQALGRIEIRKALGEINRAVLSGHPRHAADDRLAEGAGTIARLWHGFFFDP